MIEFILILLFCVGLFIYLNKETLLYRMLHVFETLSGEEYVHYSCPNCVRNLYIKYSSLTEDEKNYGIQCCKCKHMLSRKRIIDFDSIPVGSEVIN